jgi:transposase-like protein
MRIVRESDSESVCEVGRKHRIAEQTLYRWRRTYAGMRSNTTKRYSGASIMPLSEI